jgi:hypothetical protein
MAGAGSIPFTAFPCSSIVISQMREAHMTKRAISLSGVLGVAMPAFIALVGPAVAQGKFIGSNVDVRTVLNFKVSDAAVEKLLPAGWEVNSPASGPSQGANIALTLVDSVMAQDGEGKPVAAQRLVVLAIPARRKVAEASGAMVVAGLGAADSVPGAYGVYLPARALIERTVKSESGGKSHVDERWSFKAEDGSAFDVQLQFERGPVAKAKAEPKVFSGANPDFFRIYRIEQGLDVARSTAAGTDRVSRVSITASGPRFTSVFDGSEQLISVISIPWYSRQLYLPSGS